MVVIRKWEFLGTHMDKSREVEEQNRLRDQKRHNHDEAKEIVVHAKKPKKKMVR